MSADTADEDDGRHIVTDVHDEPHLAGHRLTVRFIQTQVEERGLTPRTVANRYDVDIAAVYRALAYYHDHPAEMRAVEQAREAALEAHEDLTTDTDAVRECRSG
jgi:uncharacterized protein (DUF433 family)